MAYIFNVGTSDEITLTQIVFYTAIQRETVQYDTGSLTYRCFNLFESIKFKELRPYYDDAGSTSTFFPLFKRTGSSVYFGIMVEKVNGHTNIGFRAGQGHPEGLELLYSFDDSNAPSSMKAAFCYSIPDRVAYPDYQGMDIMAFPEYIDKAHVTQHVTPNAYGGNLGLWVYVSSVNRVAINSFPVIYYNYMDINIHSSYSDPVLFVEIPEYTPYYDRLGGYPPGSQVNPSNMEGTDGESPEHTEPEPPEDIDPFDPSEPEPYAPQVDDTSDEIDIPTDPPIGVSSVGFINVYKTSLNSLLGLGDILFPNPATATDIVDAVYKLCQTIANSNLINYVIDCHVVPVTPTTGTNVNIKVGYRDTNISAPKVTSDYVNVSCGTLSIPEYFGGFADYAATKSKIYLPFIGFVDTKPEFWQAGVIGIDYKFNVIDGSFMAYIRSTSSKSQLQGTVIAQYSGNACMHFPLTGVNYASMVSGIIGSVTAPSSSGSVSPALGAALSAANTIAAGGDVQQSNGYNSTAALLGVRVPYLMIERATPSYSSNYRHDKGYPSNISTQLSNVSGYTEIEDIDLSGIPLTQGELEELRQLLSDGVYF